VNGRCREWPGGNDWVDIVNTRTRENGHYEGSKRRMLIDVKMIDVWTN
jgi:hypothetical protein